MTFYEYPREAAISTLFELMTSPSTPADVRLEAARIVLSLQPTPLETHDETPWAL